jgi:hypothetical protein
MSIDECNLIQEIFRLKKIKSDWIRIQSYENAANVRDEERKVEKELVLFLKKKSYDLSDNLGEIFWFISDSELNHDLVTQKIREYFLINFDINYPINMVKKDEQLIYENFVKKLLRQKKLNSLGI